MTQFIASKAHQDLGRDFFDPVAPADFPKTILRHRDRRWADRIGLGRLSEQEWLAHFGRFTPLPGSFETPLALRYHGHQFRSYNPELGDGRGFLFAQCLDPVDGRLLDFGTKGSGKTPWSRGGDGRLTLKGGVREVLATEMLEALGVYTSKSLSLVETGEDLVRGDEPSPTRSSVLTRLSHSHIRFGTFQRQAFLQRPDNITVLVDHAVETYFPTIADEPDRPRVLLEQVVAASARLCARWMAAGFVHGVLNTDNMVVTGESFDYGPWRFLPRNDPNFTAAYFDHSGLYSFGRQPETVFWNLQQLAACLAQVTDDAGLIAALNSFSDLYRDALRAAMLDRLGLKSRSAGDDVDLVQAAFVALAAGGEALRWEPFFFDWFGGEASEARALAGPRGELYGQEAFLDFRRGLAAFETDRPERLESPVFGRPEPEEMLIDEVEALWAPIAQADDWTPLNEKLARIEAARVAYALGLTYG